MNQAVAVIRLEQSTAMPEFILGHLLSTTGLKQILGTAVNTARENVSLESLRKTWIPLPPVAAQAEICERLSALEKMRKLATNQGASLCCVRDAFLNQIFPAT